jgi:hypothetical protein
MAQGDYEIRQGSQQCRSQCRFPPAHSTSPAFGTAAHKTTSSCCCCCCCDCSCDDYSSCCLTRAKASARISPLGVNYKEQLSHRKRELLVPTDIFETMMVGIVIVQQLQQQHLFDHCVSLLDSWRCHLPLVGNSITGDCLANFFTIQFSAPPSLALLKTQFSFIVLYILCSRGGVVCMNEDSIVVSTLMCLKKEREGEHKYYCQN